MEKRTEIPQFEQLNPVVNTTSAYFYRTGNIDLQPAARYQASLSYKMPIRTAGNFLNTSISFIQIPNNIVENIIIPESSGIRYNGVIVPVGTTLTYYGNSGNYKYVYGSHSIAAAGYTSLKYAACLPGFLSFNPSRSLSLL